MTQEEKAKSYDKAIDKLAHFIKKHIGSGCLIRSNSSEAKELFNIFPELKESEIENADEKIRKALIKLVTNHASMDLFIEYDIHLYEALSWLKKQGKNNTGISKSVKQNLEDNLNKALEKETSDSWNAFLNGQGEQKPSNKVEPNLAWSEKDEYWRQKAIGFMKHPDLIKVTPTLAKDTIDWLKSLRPQNTWKPSDEQLEALKEACDKHWDPDGLDPLYTLYQDLKKLRDE